jgi:hypothetical protein
MAEHSVGRQVRGHPSPFQRDHAVAHGVHPAVKGVEPARFDSSLDRPRPHRRREQLAPADHPVLRLGKARDHSIRAKVAYFSPYTGVN